MTEMSISNVEEIPALIKKYGTESLGYRRQTQSEDIFSNSKASKERLAMCPIIVRLQALVFQI